MDRIKPLSGTYALVLYSRVNRKVEVGRLGVFCLKPGYYVYVGSAFGPGGLRARINRQIHESNKKHWHLDYIKKFTKPIEIWYSYDPAVREHQWAGAIIRDGKARVLMKGFGSSDCSCAAHLFFLNKRPLFEGFVKGIQEESKAHDRVYILKLEEMNSK